MFKKINQQWEACGVAIESAKGAVIDATVIESAARPKRVIEMTADREASEESKVLREDEGPVIRESVDPDAKWLKKGKRSYFGFKGFVRASEGDGFIQTSNKRVKINYY